MMLVVWIDNNNDNPTFDNLNHTYGKEIIIFTPIGVHIDWDDDKVKHICLFFCVLYVCVLLIN